MLARLLVAYHGAGFHGFAENAGVRTVAGDLRGAIEQVLGSPVELTCAGRTDKGVHAWGQVVSLDLPDGVDLDRLRRSVTGLLQPEVVVRAADPVPVGFDARFSAVSRTYRYTVVNRAVPDPFRSDTAWHIPRPLDVRAMNKATDPLIGEHDFSSFCRVPKVREGQPVPSLVRRVHRAQWRPRPESGEGLLEFEIHASAFCHQMVRSVVGTLVDVGLGRRTPGDMMGILRARDRQVAGQIAPPHGLCLWEVGYPEDGA